MSRGIKQSFVTELDQVDSRQLEPKLGLIRTDDTGIVYRYVKYDPTAAAGAAADAEVRYKTGLVGAFTITHVVGEGTVLAGRLVAAVAAKPVYCWIQVKGLNLAGDNFHDYAQ